MNGTTDSMDMSLSKLRELVMNWEAQRAAVHVVTKSWTQLSDWSELNIKLLNWTWSPSQFEHSVPPILNVST